MATPIDGAAVGNLIDSLAASWPTLLVLLGGFYGLMRWQAPKAVKESLMNGSGDVVRGIVSTIVRSENELQTRNHTQELDSRFKRHQDDEDERFRALEEKVFRRRAKRRI